MRLPEMKRFDGVIRYDRENTYEYLRVTRLFGNGYRSRSVVTVGGITIVDFDGF